MAVVVSRNAGVRITGLRETVRRLERLGVETQDLKKAFGRISNRIVTKAVGRVNTRSGRLAGSIRPGNTKNRSVVRAGYASRAPHAGPNNYGWPARNIRASHFLTDPANEDQPRNVADIEAELRTLVRRLNA